MGRFLGVMDVLVVPVALIVLCFALFAADQCLGRLLRKTAHVCAGLTGRLVPSPGRAHVHGDR
jgi:hypothetical protein